jgi:hypothetical protein
MPDGRWGDAGKEREFKWQENMTWREYHANLLYRWNMKVDFLRSAANNRLCDMTHDRVAAMQRDVDEAYTLFHAAIRAGRYGEPRYPV